MNRETILKLAREAGFESDSFGLGIWDSQDFNNFANLIAQHQKEKDTEICEELAKQSGLEEGESCWQWMECASAIRNQEV